MKDFRIACCLCALIVLSASAASAGESAPVLTLDKAVSLALEKSPMLNSAKLGVSEAGHRQEAARADFFPKMSTDYSYTKLDQPPEMRFVSTQNSALQSLVTGNKVEVGPGRSINSAPDWSSRFLPAVLCSTSTGWSSWALMWRRRAR